ncbi:35875_t:CDS:2, partial [Racocetra persica]
SSVSTLLELADDRVEIFEDLVSTLLELADDRVEIFEDLVLIAQEVVIGDSDTKGVMVENSDVSESSTSVILELVADNQVGILEGVDNLIVREVTADNSDASLQFLASELSTSIALELVADNWAGTFENLETLIVRDVAVDDSDALSSLSSSKFLALIELKLVQTIGLEFLKEKDFKDISTITPLKNTQNLNIYNNIVQSYNPEIQNINFNSSSSASINLSTSVLNLSENYLELGNFEKNRLGLDDFEDMKNHESSFFQQSELDEEFDNNI